MRGEAFIIGGTANTFEDVKLHHAAGADYLAADLHELKQLLLQE